MIHRVRVALGAVLVAGALAASGCGGTDHGRPLAAVDQVALRAKLADARAAAAKHDRAGVRTSLRAFRTEVALLVRRHRVAAADAAVLTAGARQAERRVHADVPVPQKPAPPATTTPAPAPAPAPPSATPGGAQGPGKPGDKGKGKDQGKGKGKH
jgi:hypothetical protein